MTFTGVVIAQDDSINADYEKIFEEIPDQDEYADEEDAEPMVFTDTYYQDSLHIQKREVGKESIPKLKKSDAFWYADFEPETGKIQKREEAAKGSYVPFMQQTWFQTILWFVIIAGFGIALAIFLSNSNVNLFRKKNVEIASGPGDLETEDIFAINYQKEIDKAVRANDYRLAVRLMYLRLLKNMSDRNIIRYSQGKTNFDYLADLQPTSYYKTFFRVTRHYEYAWYGHFEVSSEAYSRIAAEFNNMEKSFY